MLKYFKNQRGFSLLEVILSIATVSILSIFILRMFMVSSTANLKAKNMDIASNYATSFIEEFKAFKSVDDFFQNMVFEGSQISLGESEFIVIDNDYAFSGIKIDQCIRIYTFFNEKWNIREIKAVESDPLSPKEEDIKFAMLLKVSPDEDSESLPSGSLYKIEVSIYDVSYDEDKKELAGYSSLKYFPSR